MNIMTDTADLRERKRKLKKHIRTMTGLINDVRPFRKEVPDTYYGYKSLRSRFRRDLAKVEAEIFQNRY